MPKITRFGGVTDAADLPAESDVDDVATEPAGEQPSGSAEDDASGGDDGLPKRNASKDEWVAAAVGRGWDPATAEALTRDELVAALTEPAG